MGPILPLGLADMLLLAAAAAEGTAAVEEYDGDEGEVVEAVVSRCSCVSRGFK